jgi:hypothetical protein
MALFSKYLSKITSNTLKSRSVSTESIVICIHFYKFVITRWQDIIILFYYAFFELIQRLYLDPYSTYAKSQNCCSLLQWQWHIFPPIPQQIQNSVDQPYAGPAASWCSINGTHSTWLYLWSVHVNDMEPLHDDILIWPVHLVWMTARLQQDTFLSWHLAPASEVTRGLTLPF